MKHPNEKWVASRVPGMVEGFEYEVYADEPLDEIIQLASDAWDGEEAWRSVNRRPRFKPSDERLALNFLRHERSNYDFLLAPVRRRQGAVTCDEVSNQAAAIVRENIHDMIVEKYPDLGFRAAMQARSTSTMIGGRTFHVGRGQAVS